jgi:hypothetical protein
LQKIGQETFAANTDDSEASGNRSLPIIHCSGGGGGKRATLLRWAC